MTGKRRIWRREYAANGRDAVNIVQLACGVVFSEARQVITRDDIEWVVNTGRYIKRPEHKGPARYPK